MPGKSTWSRAVGAFVWTVLVICASASRSSAQSPTLPAEAADDSAAITNIAQLTHALSSAERLYRSVRLEGVVCAASDPSAGVLVLQDDTGVEFLELGRRAERLVPGERIRVEGEKLLLRQREWGTQISAAPVVDNDGLHPWKALSGQVALKAGRVALECDWFNCLRNFGLRVTYQVSGRQDHQIAASALWHADLQPGSTSPEPAPGLHAECYEGYWERVPDFDLLRPATSGIATNLTPGFRSRDELVGLRYTGFFDVPSNGTYTFIVSSDDGALLFIGAGGATVSRLGGSSAPSPAAGWIGEAMDQLEERRWLTIEGRVDFISPIGKGLALELRSGVSTLSVVVADASGLDPAALLNSYVRASGVGRAALNVSHRIVLNRLLVAGSQDLQRVEVDAVVADAPVALVPINHVQTMRVGEAKRELPVRVRGVVTAANHSDRWFSLQDDTRGVFVDHHTLSNAFISKSEMWEVIGHTAPGNFAPIIVANEMKRLGEGCLPEPARPTWNELANGSMDVQWVEFQGLVSGVQSNRLSLLLPQGSLEVQMEDYFESDLRQFQGAIVRILGTLFAIWNTETREVQFGSVLMRNAKVSVDVPPPADPFNAPAKTVRGLLLFDVQATAFHPVKVKAQVLYVNGQEIFAMDEESGLRILAADPVNPGPGEWIEAVGYPEISGPSPVLRQALVRKTGMAMLPKPRILTGTNLTQKGLDATRVRLEGKLIGMHLEQLSPVLEMQSSGQLFVARIRLGASSQLSLRPGSQLQLTGVYSQTGGSRRMANDFEAFELLLNTPFDIRVLSQPSWWTLERLGAVVGALVVVLLLAAVWISLLHKTVEQRTRELQNETRERERAERQRAIEAERSRIARDLHDDLGSGLSEINMLAGAGRRKPAEGINTSSIFQAIASKTRGLIAGLDVIVWAVNPEDNSLQSLADYLSSFTRDFLSHSGLVCRLKVPIVFPPLTLDGRIRHELLMAVKESLNNIVRHAGATEVECRMGVVDAALEIVIADNGKGFDTAVPTEGRGLRNLSARLAKLGGGCSVNSAPGGGTTVSIQLPLSVPVIAKANSVTT
jgi:signal transduction histidine kinase